MGGLGELAAVGTVGPGRGGGVHCHGGGMGAIWGSGRGVAGQSPRAR